MAPPGPGPARRADFSGQARGPGSQRAAGQLVRPDPDLGAAQVDAVQGDRAERWAGGASADRFAGAVGRTHGDAAHRHVQQRRRGDVGDGDLHDVAGAVVVIGRRARDAGGFQDAAEGLRVDDVDRRSQQAFNADVVEGHGAATAETGRVAFVGVGIDEGTDVDVQVRRDRQAVLAADGAQFGVLDRRHGRGREGGGGEGGGDDGFDQLHDFYLQEWLWLFSL